jgi:hypothetical protein
VTLAEFAIGQGFVGILVLVIIILVIVYLIRHL